MAATPHGPSIDELNQRFSHPNHVHFFRGRGDLIACKLTHPSGASAEVYLQGAHVTSYRTSEGDEVLFVSSKAVFQSGKAIRGGIPVCFPQFGAGVLPQHGFARNSLWSVKTSAASIDGVDVTLMLRDSESTRAVWPYAFSVELQVSVQPRKLAMEMIVSAPSGPISFTCALHSYFSVPSIQNVTLQGLQGLKYVDKVRQAQTFTEDPEIAIIQSETDRVYLNAPDKLYIQLTADSKQVVSVSKGGFSDAVLWNAWQERARTIADLGPDDWTGYVCLEPANVGNPVSISSGTAWVGRQEISRSRLL